MAALANSLRTLRAAGVPAIAAHVAQLQRRFLDRLERLPAWCAEARRLTGLLDRDRLGSILALHHGRRGEEGLQRILERGFELGIYASVREGYLRIALHGWHDDADLDRLVDWLATAEGATA